MSVKKVVLALLLAEEEEEDELFSTIAREPHADMFRTRRDEGFHNLLIHGHLKDDPIRFRSFFRLNVPQFTYILSLVEDTLYVAGCSRVPNPIAAEEKLSLTLRYLATGESFSSLSFAFRISPAYIGVIIRQTLQALRDTLVPIFMPTPTEETLVQSAAKFRDRWNFPNCVGAIDGKHVRIFCPNRSGSLYFNYKNYFSISMLALVDPNYKFLAVDVGSYGKEGDSGIFDKSEFGRLLGNSNFYPPDAPPPGSNTPLPHVIVGDEAFRLEKHVMKPFNRAAARADRLKAIFNYRLSRARRVSENSFALLSQVWRIYYSHISVAPEVADLLILVTCCLHNMLRDAYLEDNEEPYHVLDPQDAQPEYFSDFNRVGGFRQFEGFAVRDKYAQYFSGEGAVAWQETRI